MSFSIPGYWEPVHGPKLAVTGGRDTHVSDEDWEWLAGVYVQCGATGWVLGDARGVDFEVAHRLGGMTDVSCTVFFADWETHGKSAGPRRNQRMIDAADFLAAFPGGKGTADCVRRAEKKGIPVFRREG